MDIEALREEIVGDPEGLGYKALGSDVQALADRLNDPSRQAPGEPLSAGELVRSYLPADRFAGMTADDIARIRLLMDLGSLDMGSDNVLGLLKVALGEALGAALDARAKRLVSRATEIGLPFVGPHHVKEALSLVDKG